MERIIISAKLSGKIEVKKMNEVEYKYRCIICGNPTNNPDKICDNCKLSMVFNPDIPPNLF